MKKRQNQAEQQIVSMLNLIESSQQEKNYEDIGQFLINLFVQNDIVDVQEFQMNEYYKSQYISFNQQKEKDIYVAQIQSFQVSSSELLLVSFLKNITDKEQLAQKILEIQYKDRMISNTSHDLRTPLNGIIGLSEVAKFEESIDKISQYLNIINKTAHLMSFLIADILDQAKLNNQQIRINVQEFEIQTTIQDIFEITNFSQPQLRSKNITLSYDLNLTEIYIISDESRLKQILINFLSNALKFTKEGSITVTVEEDMNDKNLLLISVIDTGAGIPIDIQRQMFKEFKTFDRGYNKSGTGLGLMICKNLIGKLGPFEWIFLDSQEGLGSKFSFLIYRELSIQNESERKLQIQLYESQKDSLPNKDGNLDFQIYSCSPVQSKFNSLNQRIQQQYVKNKQDIFSFQSRQKPIRVNEINSNCNLIQNKMVNNKQCIASSNLFETELEIQRSISQQVLTLKRNKSCRSSFDSSNKKPKRSFESQIGQDMENIFQQKNLAISQVQENASFTVNSHLKSNFIIHSKEKTSDPNIKQSLDPIQQQDDSTIVWSQIFEKKVKDVLIVDDMEFNLIPLQAFLKRIPYVNVYKAYNGEQAIKFVMDNPTLFDIIFMDVQMPIKDGFQAVDEIQQFLSTKKNHKKIYITILTAGDQEDLEKFEKSKADNLIFKPLTQRKFINVVKQYQEEYDAKQTILLRSRPPDYKKLENIQI